MWIWLRKKQESIDHYETRGQQVTQFLRQKENSVYSYDIDSQIDEFAIGFMKEGWRVFIGSSKTSLKDI